MQNKIDIKKVNIEASWNGWFSKSGVKSRGKRGFAGGEFRIETTLQKELNVARLQHLWPAENFTLKLLCSFAIPFLQFVLRPRK